MQVRCGLLGFVREAPRHLFEKYQFETTHGTHCSAPRRLGLNQFNCIRWKWQV